jgi:hypothetical protein
VCTQFFFKLCSSILLLNLCLFLGTCANQHTTKEYWHGFESNGICVWLVTSPLKQKSLNLLDCIPSEELLYYHFWIFNTLWLFFIWLSIRLKLLMFGVVFLVVMYTVHKYLQPYFQTSRWKIVFLQWDSSILSLQRGCSLPTLQSLSRKNAYLDMCTTWSWKLMYFWIWSLFPRHTDDSIFNFACQSICGSNGAEISVYSKLKSWMKKKNSAFGETIHLQYPGDLKSVVGKGLLY